jgi:MarR family transcriptional regulator, organic hydroperoxide resistance regulator
MKRVREGGFLIAKIHHLAGRIFDRLLREHGITAINAAQGRILFALWQHDAMSITELAAKTSLEKSTLSAMLERLVRAGHLVRSASKEDGRKIIIARTNKDRAMQKVYEAISGEMTSLFYRGFSAEEIGEFEGYLARILETLRAHDKGVGRGRS